MHGPVFGEEPGHHRGVAGGVDVLAVGCCAVGGVMGQSKPEEPRARSESSSR